MMKLLLPVLFFVVSIKAFAITGEEILRKVDANVKFKSIIYTGTMEIIAEDEEPRYKIMKAYAIGEKKAYVEFLNKEDMNTKYLKIDKQLWIRDGSEQNTFLISGHMLKQGIMGSDMSYEDALEADSLYEKYAITLSGEESLNGRPCYVVSLTAKVKNAPYDKRKMWIDKERFFGLKAEMYSKSGILIKTENSLDVKEIQGRYFPVKTEILNNLRKGSKTVMTMKEIILDSDINPKYFTRRYLER